MDHIEVMVVDDEPDMRFMLRTYLPRLGDFDMTREASNGAEALELIRARCPEAVLLDIGMPVMNGIEATWQIRDLCPHTKIIILSAFPSEELQREAIARGADLYLENSRARADTPRLGGHLGKGVLPSYHHWMKCASTRHGSAQKTKRM